MFTCFYEQKIKIFYYREKNHVEVVIVLYNKFSYSQNNNKKIHENEKEKIEFKILYFRYILLLAMLQKLRKYKL